MHKRVLSQQRYAPPDRGQTFTLLAQIKHVIIFKSFTHRGKKEKWANKINKSTNAKTTKAAKRKIRRRRRIFCSEEKTRELVTLIWPSAPSRCKTVFWVCELEHEVIGADALTLTGFISLSVCSGPKRLLILRLRICRQPVKNRSHLRWRPPPRVCKLVFSSWGKMQNKGRCIIIIPSRLFLKTSPEQNSWWWISGMCSSETPGGGRLSFIHVHITDRWNDCVITQKRLSLHQLSFSCFLGKITEINSDLHIYRQRMTDSAS